MRPQSLGQLLVDNHARWSVCCFDFNTIEFAAPQQRHTQRVEIIHPDFIGCYLVKGASGAGGIAPAETSRPSCAGPNGTNDARLTDSTPGSAAIRL